MKKTIRLGVILNLTVFATLASATDLMQVYQDAYNNNPTFLQAKATAQGIMQEVPIARAGLLPAANATATDGFNNYNNNSGSSASSIILPSGASIPLDNHNGTFRYNQNGYEISASQPIFNVMNWLGYNSAKYTANSASATFNYALQTLIANTATAYFSVLDAEDNLTYVQAEKQANYESLTQAQQKFEVGLIPITDVEQARAQYDTNVASELGAQNAVLNAKENLRALTGVYYANLSSLRDNTAPLLTPQPANVTQWVETADKQNWNLISARQTAEAAHKSAQEAQAGHLPVLNGVASYTGNNTGDSPSGQQDTKVAYAGLQLTVPIFSNGMGFVSATAKQASYAYEAAVQSRNGVYLSTVNNTRQSFNNTMSYISQVEADKQTIKSSSLALQSIVDGYQIGTKTMLDVLTAQQDLYNAYSAFSNDQYTYINATIALKQSAGTLSPLDLQQINAWLAAERKPFTSTQYSTDSQNIKRSPLSPLGGGT